MAKKAKKKTKTDDDDDLGLDEGDEESSGKKGGKGKLIAIIAVASLVILGGAGGGLFYFGLLDSLLGIGRANEHAEEESMVSGGDPLDLGKPVYYEMPEFIADLKTDQCRSPYLRLALTIQIDHNDQDVLIERHPKIVDRILRHLRDQERQSLVGEEGARRLRQDIILIVNAAIKPVKIHNVLFRSLTLQ